MNVRTNSEARRGIPMSAAQVATYIAEMDQKTKSKAARIRMAELAIAHGNITPEGKEVWCTYLAKESGK